MSFALLRISNSTPCGAIFQQSVIPEPSNHELAITLAPLLSVRSVLPQEKSRVTPGACRR